MSRGLSLPRPIADDHRLTPFDCGEPTLDDWLKRRALYNHRNGASRTFVVVDSDKTVCGYYALAAGAVSHHLATGAVRRNMPDPIPVMVLGRLAVDRRYQGIHLGAALLQDAVKRAINVSRELGVRALVVHALNEGAQRFYTHYGFLPSPAHAMTLMLRLQSGGR